MSQLDGKTAAKYFIGANTPQGFVNYADDILSSMTGIYIIKGAPGTGKSTFMFALAREAEKKGLETEYYYCSSDPSSLDAVTIPKLGIAVTDGTAPHSRDADFPGVRDNIINLGMFWDSAKLKKDSEEISRLSKQKKELFDTAYRYMKIYSLIGEERHRILERCVNVDKLDAAMSRLSERLGKGTKFILRHKQVSSVGMSGITDLDTYQKLASHNILICDRHGIFPHVTSALLREAKERKLEVWIDEDPFDPRQICALYFPESKTCFARGSDATICEKVINTDRFIIKEKERSDKNKLKFLAMIGKELYPVILDTFSNAAKAHFATEERYKCAMDFSGLEKFTSKTIKKILS